MPGICTSRNRRSGGSFVIAARASPPSAKAPPTSRSGSRARSSRRRLRAGGSSSTTNVRILVMSPPRDSDGHGHARPRAVREAQPRFLSIERSEASSHVFESEAAPILAPGLRKSDSVVADDELERARAPLRTEKDGPRFGFSEEAVLDGVLDQRLQEESGNGGGQGLRSYVPLDP